MLRAVSAGSRYSLSLSQVGLPPEGQRLSGVNSFSIMMVAAAPSTPSAKLQDQLNNPEIPVREGWLFKEGHMRKTWKKRWFQVPEGLGQAAPRSHAAHARLLSRVQLTSWGNLNYYDAEDGKELDTIPLGGCTIFVPNSRRADYPHAFRLNLDVGSGEKHKYILSGTSEIDSRDWQQSILRFAPLPSSKDAGGDDKPAGKRSTMSKPSHGRRGRTVGTARGHARARTHRRLLPRMSHRLRHPPRHATPSLLSSFTQVQGGALQARIRRQVVALDGRADGGAEAADGGRGQDAHPRLLGPRHRRD